MDQAHRTEAARDLMLQFAASTGLSPPAMQPRRYLWTDAFAVCNFLALWKAYRDVRFHDLAILLVEQVHGTLGRHRADDQRRGWISGLHEVDGSSHPTAGGLRIGKKLPERTATEPYDPDLEWERDGQYLHYLTKWMHALCRVSAATGEARPVVWASELAEAAWRGFAVDDGKRLVWKASINLSRPLVSSMGHHDPLDGYISVREVMWHLQHAGAMPHQLEAELRGFHAICSGKDWTTSDPLGLGGLLFDAARVAQLAGPEPAYADLELLRDLLQDARTGIAAWLGGRPLQHPATRRLAFRELGLSIGLRGLPAIRHCTSGWTATDHILTEIDGALQALETAQPLASMIEDYWLQPQNQAAASWQDHVDINAVMLATSLVPEDFLFTGEGAASK
jgi:hypothetical protein